MIHIKTPQEIEEFKVAGSLSKAVLRRAGRMVRPGVTTREIDQVVESFIRLHGAVPGFKGAVWVPCEHLCFRERGDRAWHSLRSRVGGRRRNIHRHGCNHRRLGGRQRLDVLRR